MRMDKMADGCVADVNGSVLIDLHKRLLRLRITEETLAARYREQEMRTPTHFGTGQEAIAVGVCAALRQSDVVFSHHRCHNHYLAKGGGVFELASELYGRATGCSGGRGGSVHLTDVSHGMIASSAILGETPAVAAGAALAFKMDSSDRVSVTFFGDGAMDEGAIYETLNFAAVHQLPILFVCENNIYATESPPSVRQAEGTDMCERAEAFKVPSQRIDGNDVAEAFRVTDTIVRRMRSGSGPFFLEGMTYRWREHVGPMFDHELDRTYRSRSEVEFWMAEKCPVRRSAARLLELQLAKQADLDAWEAASTAEIHADVERARNASWPEPATLFDNV
jgi:TPP-dependent pyruvate/acetoin dehydrogenase alpha subunit